MSEDISRSIESLSDEERKTIRGCIQELSKSMARVDGEKEYQKSAITDICEKLSFDKKLLRKMATTYHKANFNELSEAHSEFETYYDFLINGATADD